MREAREETGLTDELIHQLHADSDPARDTRGDSVCAVFIAGAQELPHAGPECGGSPTVGMPRATSGLSAWTSCPPP